MPCPACGAANEPGDKFCGECGGPLLDSAPPPAATASVSERRLGDELNVRVGVLTGCAAVELGAEGEGMVLGDTVNTASRLQSIAAPGSVLVDDVTRSEEEAIELLRTVGARPLLAKALLERAHPNVAIVAFANKLARIAWAVLRRGERFVVRGLPLAA